MTILVAALALAQTPTIQVTQVKVIPGIRPIAFAAAPTGTRFVACMEDGSVRIMDSKLRQTIRQMPKHPQPAYAAAWSPDGNFIATGDESARIWISNPLTGQKTREYRTHTKGIQKLSYNSTGLLLLSTGKDDQINIYNLTSPKPKEARVILGKGTNFYGAAFHSKLPYTLAVGMLAGGARFYNATNGNINNFLTDEGGQGTFDVAFNKSATRAVTAGRDGNAILWDVAKYKKLGKFVGHGDWVVNVAFSPNGKLVATSSSDRTVKVWNAYTFQKIADLKDQSPVGSPLCFTADGSTLVTTNDAGFLQFNAISPAQPATEEPAKKATKTRKSRRHKSRG